MHKKLPQPTLFKDPAEVCGGDFAASKEEGFPMVQNRSDNIPFPAVEAHHLNILPRKTQTTGKINQGTYPVYDPEGPAPLFYEGDKFFGPAVKTAVPGKQHRKLLPGTFPGKADYFFRPGKGVLWFFSGYIFHGG
jgi:hypothetical protein